MLRKIFIYILLYSICVNFFCLELKKPWSEDFEFMHFEEKYFELLEVGIP